MAGKVTTSSASENFILRYINVLIIIIIIINRSPGGK